MDRIYGIRDRCGGHVYWHAGSDRHPGVPFTLAAAWREAEGCGNVDIVDARGRVVLRDAGCQVGRRYAVRDVYRARRMAAYWLAGAERSFTGEQARTVDRTIEWYRAALRSSGRVRVLSRPYAREVAV